MIYEVRFYDKVDTVVVTVQLTAADQHAAEQAARRYLLVVAGDVDLFKRLKVGVVKECR